jgi:hypothetical protein
VLQLVLVQSLDGVVKGRFCVHRTYFRIVSVLTHLLSICLCIVYSLGPKLN